MRRFHKYFNTQENFETKKKAIDNTNNEYIDADGDNVFDPDEIEVKWDDICFIAGNENSLPKIYTHGEYYGGNTVSLDTAYTTYTHGLADALDVATTCTYINNNLNNTTTYAYAYIGELTYHVNVLDTSLYNYKSKTDTELLDIDRSIDDLSYVFSKIETNHEYRLNNIENGSEPTNVPDDEISYFTNTTNDFYINHTENTYAMYCYFNAETTYTSKTNIFIENATYNLVTTYVLSSQKLHKNFDTLLLPSNALLELNASYTNLYGWKIIGNTLL